MIGAANNSGDVTMMKLNLIYTHLETTVLVLVLVLLFYAIGTVFQFYLDNDMMYEIREKKARACNFTDSWYL